MSDRQRLREVLGSTSLPCPYCQRGPMMITRTERVRRLIDWANPRFHPDVLHHEVCAVCSATFVVSEERIRGVLPSRTSAAAASPTVAATVDDDDHLFLEAAAEPRTAEQAESQAAADEADRGEAEARATTTAQAEEAGDARSRDEAAARTTAVERRLEGAAAEELALTEQRARAAAEADVGEQSRVRAHELAELQAGDRASAGGHTPWSAEAETPRPGVEPQPTTELPAAAPLRATGPWGRAEITGRPPEQAPSRAVSMSSILVGRPTKVGAGRRSGPLRCPGADHAG